MPGLRPITDSIFALASMEEVPADVIIDRGSVWLPPDAAYGAFSHDTLFSVIYYACVALFFAATAISIYFVIKKHTRSSSQTTRFTKRITQLKVLASAGLSVFLLIVFVWGHRGFIEQSIPPADALEIRVVGSQFKWQFQYPRTGCRSRDLVVPLNVPIRLTMISTDVVHSLSIPAFRVKRDVQPDRYSVVWFQASEEGIYDAFCSEYCGAEHAAMRADVRVVSREEYESYQVDECLRNDPELLFASQPCATCHAVTPTGGPEVGPRLYGIAGTEVEMEDGTMVLVDAPYMRESMVDPNAQVRKDYEKVMPALRGLLSEPQIDVLVDYMMSLGAEGR